MIHETKHSFWPFIVAGVLITGLVVWLGFQVRTGLLTNTDELATAERSREMLLLGRTTVHYNFQPSFSKPPLQYWLTSLTLPRFQNRELAVRIWPAIYGALTAMALAGLTLIVDPRRSWLIPLSVAFLISYPLFLAETVSGLLDAGLTFLTISAILFAQLARRKPIWWLAVAAICAGLVAKRLARHKFRSRFSHFGSLAVASNLETWRAAHGRFQFQRDEYPDRADTSGSANLLRDSVSIKHHVDLWLARIARSIRGSLAKEKYQRGHLRSLDPKSGRYRPGRRMQFPVGPICHADCSLSLSSSRHCRA
jgi:hypothetical protein